MLKAKRERGGRREREVLGRGGERERERKLFITELCIMFYNCE